MSLTLIFAAVFAVLLGLGLRRDLKPSGVFSDDFRTLHAGDDFHVDWATGTLTGLQTSKREDAHRQWIGGRPQGNVTDPAIPQHARASISYITHVFEDFLIAYPGGALDVHLHHCGTSVTPPSHRTRSPLRTCGSVTTGVHG